MLNPTRGATAATPAMANPAAAAQHQARGGDGAAGRPAAEQAQGTSSPRLLVAAPAPAPDQQPRLAGAAGAGGGAPKQAPRGSALQRWSARRARRAADGRGGRRRSRSRARGATGHAAVPRGGACSAAGRPAAPSPPLAGSAAAPPPPGSCRALSWLSGAGAVLGGAWAVGREILSARVHPCGTARSAQPLHARGRALAARPAQCARTHALAAGVCPLKFEN